MWNQRRAVGIALVKAGIKQSDLARMMNRHPQVIYQWKSGRRVLSITTAEEISSAIGMKFSDFIKLGEE